MHVVFVPSCGASGEQLTGFNVAVENGNVLCVSIDARCQAGQHRH